MPHLSVFREPSPTPLPSEADTEPSPESLPETLWPNISPTRFWIVFLSLWISLFMSTIDTTIVTTALPTISADLPGKLNPTWLLVSYLLTYTSFLLVSSSICEIFSIKTVLLFCNLGFLAASLLCSVAKDMKHLVIFRALQGATGSALYNLPFVVVLKVVEPKKVSLYTTLIGGVFVMANLLGPVLGGILASAGQWRVMFRMNIPMAIVAFVLLFMAGPEEPGPFFKRSQWRSMDRIGGLMSIVWVAPIVLALQEGGAEWPWESNIIISLLGCGGALMVFFIWYEVFYLTKWNAKINPVFPGSLLRFSPMFWLIVNALFIGVTFYGAITILPSRLQIVNNMSAKKAGLHLLVMMMTVPIGALSASTLSHRFVYGAQWVALLGSTMVLIGTVLLTFLPGGMEVPISSWFGQCHLGIGFGFLGAICMFVQKDNVSYRELGVAISIYDMVRAMGGAIGVAICSAISHRNMRNEFTKVLPAGEVESLLQSHFGSINNLSPVNQRLAREAYGNVFRYEFQAIAVAAGINVLVSIAMVWTRYFVGFSLNRRGDGPYQCWRQEEKGGKEGVAVGTALENAAMEKDSGEHVADQNYAEADYQKRSWSMERVTSPAPTLPSLDFEDISMKKL
ncbi:putative MSF multidrug transporter [Venturia nashicola]|uniref:Putative MSF multidrug transporter n=1 Tax=Venturia nashicola TaxID=86259 RepID=A0A4Z1PDQ6_9PEZI|nr:putative MSF multidrug transporter [Venturia nashicola]